MNAFKAIVGCMLQALFSVWQLALVFPILRGFGAITWSWWWVTLPWWGSIVVGLVVGPLTRKKNFEWTK